MKSEKLPPSIKLERELAILKRREENAPSALDAALMGAKINAVLNLIDSRAAGSKERASAVFNLMSSRAAGSEGKSR